MNFLLTQKIEFKREVNLHKKCYCNSGKKYRNCCSGTDVAGFFDKEANIFYCNVFEFLDKFCDKLNFMKIKEKLQNEKDEKDEKKDDLVIEDNKKIKVIKTQEELKEKFDKIYI